jgi:hypothetical protein
VFWSLKRIQWFQGPKHAVGALGGGRRCARFGATRTGSPLFFADSILLLNFFFDGILSRLADSHTTITIVCRLAKYMRVYEERATFCADSIPEWTQLLTHLPLNLSHRSPRRQWTAQIRGVFALPPPREACFLREALGCPFAESPC